jgi:hypothetical protein
LTFPLVGLLGILAAPPLAAETRTWHAFDAQVFSNSRLEAVIHTRFRYDGVLDSFQQGRAGGLVRVRALPRWSLIGGYYYGKEEDHREQWRNFHRPFAGVEVALLSREGGIELATRGFIERLLGGRRGDFTRYRQRLRLTTDRRFGPYLATEWFFDGQGYLTSRHSAGVRWRFARRASLEAGYLLDLRRADVGGVLHVLTTQMQFDLRPARR